MNRKNWKLSGVVFVFFLFSPLLSYAQTFHPNHLFNTGLNIGYLVAHKESSTGQEQYSTWASSASAEWIGAWTKGSVPVIVPDINYPKNAHELYIKEIKKRTYCENPYFLTRASIYRGGFYLGKAFVKTQTDCAECLQLAMQQASVEIHTIATVLDKPHLIKLSNRLNKSAAKLNIKKGFKLAKQQNGSLAELILSDIQMLQAELSDDSGSCLTNKKANVPTIKVPVKKRQVKQRSSATNLFVGYNYGVLNGDNGTTTDRQKGWHLGFEQFSGEKLFFAYGVKFFRNETGRELMIPSSGQSISANEKYIQGLSANLGAGFYFSRSRKSSFYMVGKLGVVISHSIAGNLSDIGTTSIVSYPIHYEFNVGYSYNKFLLELGYESGLSEALTAGSEKFKYQFFITSVGVRFN